MSSFPAWPGFSLLSLFFFLQQTKVCAAVNVSHRNMCVYMYIFHHGLRTLKQLNLMQLGSPSVR